MFTISLVAALLAALAFVALVAAFAVRRAQHATRALAASLDDAERPDRIRATLLQASARLADVEGGAERALWAMSGLDEQIASTTLSMGRRRVQLDDQRTRLIAARHDIEHLRSVGRAVLKVIELRRTVFG